MNRQAQSRERRRMMQPIYQRRYRQKLVADGLTMRGTPRKKQRHDFAPHLTSQERDYLYSRAKLDRRYARGLTARGTERKPFVSVSAAEQRIKAILRKRKRREELSARGLTSRGTPRKNDLPNLGIYALGETERAWRELRSAIQIPKPELMTWAERSQAN